MKLTPWLYTSACYKGPCYSYEACVTGKCDLHIACTINQILAFWTRTYHAVVANPIGILTGPAQAVATEAQRLAIGARGVLASAFSTQPGAPAGAYTDGCPPGHYWGIGLTGISCQPFGAPQPPAPRDLLVAYGILRA